MCIRDSARTDPSELTATGASAITVRLWLGGWTAAAVGRRVRVRVRVEHPAITVRLEHFVITV